MKPINLSKFGHFNKEINSDEEYILKLLSNKKVSFSDKILKDKINIIFEGHQIINHKSLIEKLKATESKTILVITEDINGDDNLSHKYFTMNNEKLSNKKLINKKSTYYDLIFLHIKFQIKKIFKNKIDSIQRRIPIFFKKDENIYNLDYFWKERYDALLDQLQYIDEIWFLRENNLKDYHKLFNFYNIPTKIVYYKVLSLSDSYDSKTIDFLVTGTLNNYREKVINQLKKNFNVIYDEYLELNTLKKKLKETKYHLILNKSKFGLFPSSSRMKLALENDCIPLNDQTVFNDYLNQFSISFSDWEDKEKIEELLLNYKKNYDEIFKKLKTVVENEKNMQFIDDL